MSRLLALDQASKTSGYAIFVDNKLIDYGHFTFEDNDLGIRLTKIRSKVKELINTYDIDEVIFEDIQLQTNKGNNVLTFKVLAETFGVIYELVSGLRIKHSTVLSTVWKSSLAIRGQNRPIQKKNAQAFIQKTYNVSPTEDECDAICIGTYQINEHASAF